MHLSPPRTVAELRELQELTGDDNGAQRVAWTETWERAARRAHRPRSRPRPRARGSAPARGCGGVSRAPHRARPGARVARAAARRRPRHLWRRAPSRHLARPGRALRLDTDGPTPRC